MQVKSKSFIKLAQIGIADTEQRAAVRSGTLAASGKRRQAMFRHSIEHGEQLRQQAAAAKRRALADLPELLEQAEANMQKNGIEVLWARNSQAANKLVLNIAAKHHVRNIVKSKSMVTEELGLNHALEQEGYRVVETDLGEYILQLNDERPSHIVTPIIHKSKASVRSLFIDRLDMPPTENAEEMTRFARKILRHEFMTADMGISGGNFIVAETGSIGLVTNEGNGRMVTTLPKVHIAIVGIEKIVATLDDYLLLTQILPRSATGQLMTVYMQMINGPRRPSEPDGPEHMYVVLVDNGRSNIYTTGYQEALACIRCGACLNACPVYRVTGGHAYGWVYPGPIGSVVTPLLVGESQASPLPQASSLCGACLEACPVKIDIPRMLLDLRHDQVRERISSPMWDILLRIWRIGNQSPSLFQLGGRLARLFGRLIPGRLPPPLGGWTKYRTFPNFASQSFRSQWKRRQKESR